MINVASWNVNSIRVRAEQLLDFMNSYDIDVALLQETKCLDEAFPREYFEDAGYNLAIFGQKTYNGVAIVSKYRIEEVVTGDSVFNGDPQARYIEALINGYTVASVYVPNGVAPDTPQYSYKLNFLNTLKEHIRNYSNFIIGGDFNIALTDNDVYDPVLWHEKICCTQTERDCLQNMIDTLEFTDPFREKYKNNEKIYTWWNYRTNAFNSNSGLRLDYIFTTKDVVPKDAYVANEIRGLLKPSDHAPIGVGV